MSSPVSFLFWKRTQWQRQRFWRVGRYLWRRRYRRGWVVWQGKLRDFFQSLWQAVGPYRGQSRDHRDQYGTATARRFWFSLFLFGMAIGTVIWLDILRVPSEPDAKALNEPVVSPVPSAVATPPLTSIMLFENFVSPKVQTLKTPLPDRFTPPGSSAPKSSPTRSPGAIDSSPNQPTAKPTVQPTPQSTPPPATQPTSPPAYHPPYEIAWAHPSNYGNRFAKDVNGNPLTQSPIIVLHETVYSADSAVNYFQTPHSNEADQASYHTLIRLNGTIVYIVPPDKRAYGAGNSVFDGPNGPETAKTHAKYPPSVNNFAYHISLETPMDGENDGETHSGYTQAQYRSLAWLVAQSSVPDERITTHRAIDRSESRIDPRSFNFQYFLQLLHQQRSILGQ